MKKPKGKPVLINPRGNPVRMPCLQGNENILSKRTDLLASTLFYIIFGFSRIKLSSTSITGPPTAKHVHARDPDGQRPPARAICHTLDPGNTRGLGLDHWTTELDIRTQSLQAITDSARLATSEVRSQRLCLCPGESVLIAPDEPETGLG
ncbi:hypothetical protein RRG08_002195 [Elysia crispata]|uniref:Uncharacterized protein n=1 Tax=Elysia crispata TaxID=231223 RepID=A0AAE0ZAR9_9GAST|nr:hypothetical protein RRG08_002195 [Elysia crispata]